MKISVISHGKFRLDGGSMFGSVPKTLWSRQILPDEQNCIPLEQRSLLIEQNDKIILIDVGMGDKWSEKNKTIYGINNSDHSDLPSKVTDIILTHLHFDHAGGISRYDSNQKIIPSYPAARVHIQKDNLINARSPHRKEKASYLPENVNALDLYDLNQVTGDVTLFPGVIVHEVHGHTQGQQWIEIIDGKEKYFFATDLIPTSHHLHPAYNMGYDMCAKTVFKEKEAFLKRAVNEDATIVFQHDPQVAMAKVAVNERGDFVIKI